MATIARPQTPVIPAFIRRPKSSEGFWGWVTTVDHKKIGIMYAAFAFFFFLVGGVEALLVRLQLVGPNMNVLSADAYNQVFTMHGTTMVFLVVMPLGVSFFNLMIPLMIGARDVAFPRLNALSLWLLVAGGIMLNTGWLFGAAPNNGWFGYANLTTKAYSPGYGMDFWVLGLQILGISSLVGAFNFIVTILNMRAPGMTLTRMPVFIWMALLVSFLLISAMPVISVALFELSFDRFFGTNFFNVAKGGDPVLWQHLFWLFGHPEVYILILPAFGIISEVLPVFARKPLFGYTFVVFSGLAIAFMGWGVWAHHMFAVGLGPVANSAFGISTMLIAIPTGVKIFNWLGTLAGGQIKINTPLLFSVGLVALFTIGGLSGVTHAVVPSDWQQTDTYYVVAHFHYVLFGGAIFGLFAGAYYWGPKFAGRLLDDGIGKWHFWLMFIGMNLTFAPMHIVGLNGMPRRVYTYPAGMNWEFWNILETVGAFIIALATLVFMYNVFVSWIQKKGELAGPDPWDARTLEWTIPSPPPEHNFDAIPTVRARDPFWFDKYIDPTAVSKEFDPNVEPATAPSSVAQAEGLTSAEMHAEEASHGGHDHGIHMPQPSYYPLIASIGLLVAAYGLLLTTESNRWFLLIGVGVAITLLGVYGWALEPVADDDFVYEPYGSHTNGIQANGAHGD